MRKRSIKGKINDFTQVGFRALDDLTLEIRLTNPTPYFLSLLNHYSWFPVHTATISKYGPLLSAASLDKTGPFRRQRSVHTRRMAVEQPRAGEEKPDLLGRIEGRAQ